MIEFGKTYRDIVSGFEGICTGKVEWMYAEHAVRDLICQRSE